MTGLAAILARRAAEQPDDRVLGFLDERLEVFRAFTYAELDREARAVAAGLPPGARVLIALPPGPGFVVAFFACLYAGAIAVPAPPPRPGRSLARLEGIAADAGAALAVGEGLDGLRGAPATTLAALAADPAAFRPPAIAPDAPAFLQYTSGSTGTPKGVVVTHANLVANGEVIAAGFGHDAASVGLVWLPPHHDMGLIGGILQPVHAGFLMYLMSPTRFLMRPAAWLQAVSRYRATTSGGPNFGYEAVLARARPEQLAGLDLSCWRVAFNGAEPVRAATLDAFAERFAAAGFDPAAFYPCYGLAEATLMVSGGPAVLAGEPPRVGAGRPAPGHDVRVVDPETSVPCPPGAVGEIWVAGPSVAAGYWNAPEATAATFGARLADGTGPFLRTGDLGTLADGRLVVTGRLKDLIIVDGRNLHPQDLEWTAHPALRPGGGAAFAVETPEGEALFVVHEVERNTPPEALAAAAKAVRSAIAAAHDAVPHGVALVPAGAVPKTTSGKVRRAACRAALAAGELEVLHRLDGVQGREAGPGSGPAARPEGGEQ